MLEAAIGLVGVVVGAFVTGAEKYWSERRARAKNAEYLAMRVVCMLDRYMEGCTQIVGDDGLSHGQPDPDGYRQIQVADPDIPPFSADLEWKSLPAKLMYRILGFPNEIDAAKRLVDSTFELVSSPPDYEEGFEERQYQYAALGLEALAIAAELRHEYRIPERQSSEWHPATYLTDQREKIVQARARRAKNNPFAGT